VGGFSLSFVNGKTDNNDFVSTILQAGSINTPVRVRATVTRGTTTIFLSPLSLVYLQELLTKIVFR